MTRTLCTETPFFRLYWTRVTSWDLLGQVYCKQWSSLLSGPFYPAFLYLQLFLAKDQVRRKEIVSFTFPCNWLLEQKCKSISVEISAKHYCASSCITIVLFCNASCSNILLTVLQRNTHLELARHVEQCSSTCLVTYCWANCWDTIRTKKGMSLTLPEMNMSRAKFLFFLRFLTALVYKQGSRSTFCKLNYCETSAKLLPDRCISRGDYNGGNETT